MNNIQSLRKKSGLRQAELALHLGVTQQAVAKWESGMSLPRADLLPKLASTLGCTVDELLRPQTEAKETPA